MPPRSQKTALGGAPLRSTGQVRALNDIGRGQADLELRGRHLSRRPSSSRPTGQPAPVSQWRDATASRGEQTNRRKDPRARVATSARFALTPVRPFLESTAAQATTTQAGHASLSALPPATVRPGTFNRVNAPWAVSCGEAFRTVASLELLDVLVGVMVLTPEVGSSTETLSSVSLRTAPTTRGTPTWWRSFLPPSTRSESR